jgi:hypothetical protein
MTHSNTARMLAYWDARRDGDDAPKRSTIDPADFSDILTQTFMIGRERAGAYPFRLAGALLNDLHQAPLTGSDFALMWGPSDRPRLQSAVEAALARGRSLVIQGLGRSLTGAQARLEIMLAPLAGPRGQVDRMLGFYQPVSPLFRLQNKRIERLFLLDASFADGEDASSLLRLAAMDGRRIA